METNTVAPEARGISVATLMEPTPQLDVQDESPKRSIDNEKIDEKSEETSQSDLERSPTNVTEEVYSEWRPSERRFIVAIASFAALFSPLSSNIYFPIFNTLSEVLSVSATQINLTVTAYQIFQGVTPMFIAAISDGLGRRPAYVVCFVLYLAANIGLAVQTDYVALILLRCLQSAGISSTVALAKAVVADIAIPEERGLYSSLTSVGIFLGPSFGPVIGGLLGFYAGWRWVFWFLVIFSGFFFIPLLIAFPETCRKLVGNGSKRPDTWNMSLVSMFHLRRNAREGRVPEKAEKLPVKVPNFWQTIKIVFEKEMSLITITSGLNLWSFSALTTSVPSLFGKIYKLNDIQIGLCFIAVGAGCLVSSVMQGKLIDFNYRRHAKKIGFPPSKGKNQDLSKFPLEEARLQIAMPLMFIVVASTVAYGWVLEYETSIAGPLVLLFFNGFSTSAAYSVITVLIIDLYPVKPAAATAGNNLVRCMITALASATVIPMIDSLGRGWAMTLVGLVCAVTFPCLTVCMKYGMRWRNARDSRSS